MQTCRGSHTHTLVTDPKDTANIYVYGSGTGPVRPGEELAGCSAKDPDEDPNTALFSIDVIKVPLAAPDEGGDRQPSAHLRRREDRRDRRPREGRRPRPRHADGARDQPVPRHHGLSRPSGSRPAPARATASCSTSRIPVHPGPPRRRVGQELRLLALGDVQQRRHQGDLHRRVGRRHARRAAARPIRSTGAPTRSSTSSTRSCSSAATYKMPAAQTDTENCVAHNGSLIPVPGRDIMVQALVPGRRCRCSTSPTRRTRSRSPTSIAARSTRRT